MRYLGLDLGTRTLGLALSDETLTIASSLYTIRYENDEQLLDKLDKVIEEFSISKLVLGYPKNMNNTIGPKALLVEEFKQKLESRYGLEVLLQDERLSTVEATNYMLEANVSRKKRKKKIDSLAAVIILQTYLDRRNKNE